MHPRRSVQEVLLCDLCETVPLQSHCELCHINLCVICVGKHLSDSSKDHNVVPIIKHIKSTPNYPKCPKHADKHCEMFCEKCDILVCSICISSRKHKGHDISDVLEKPGSKTESLQKDLEELESRIYPRYEEMASDVQTEKFELETNYETLTTAVDQEGEVLHREITAIVNQRKSDIQEMKNKQMAALNKNTDEITQRITELRKIIEDLKKILNTKDVSLTSTYKSRNGEFRQLPPKVRVTLPSLSPQKINTEKLREMFGSPSPLSITKEQGDTMKSAEAVSPQVKPMKSAEAVSPQVKPMKSAEAVLSPQVKPMKSAEAVLSPQVKPMKSAETVSPQVKPMKSAEAVLSPQVKPMKSAETVSPQVKPMKSAEAVLSPQVKPMKSAEAVSPQVKPMKLAEAVLSPPVKPMKSAEAVSSPPVKLLLDEPRIIATIDTGYDRYGLYSVSCLSEDQVWTCGDNETMKLLNLRGKLLTSIKTKSGYLPTDIAVTRDGHLVYTDYHNNTINLIKNKQIQTVITLQGWEPRGVCCTVANDLLVTMVSDYYRKPSKVVRYSGSTETQTIQFDDQGRRLYSSGDYKYISENRNLDICVADCDASAVVVVNQSGKLRFRYTGHPSNTEQSFGPVGITTDSQSHILTADWYNPRIHILDQDGQFLRYIHCDLRDPSGLCVDIRDNLFVAEFGTAKVKKIQYL